MVEVYMKHINKLVIKLGNWLIKHNICVLSDDEKYQLKLNAENAYLQYKKKQREDLLNDRTD